MQYFSFIARSVATKTILEKAVFDYLKENERKVILAKDVATFREMILEDIKNMNTANPRCKPLKGGWLVNTRHSLPLDCQLTGLRFCDFYLYASN